VSVTVAQLYQRHHLEYLFNEKVEYALFAQFRFMPGVAKTCREDIGGNGKITVVHLSHLALNLIWATESQLSVCY
jgi:hypothetical protein